MLGALVRACRGVFCSAISHLNSGQESVVDYTCVDPGATGCVWAFQLERVIGVGAGAPPLNNGTTVFGLLTCKGGSGSMVNWLAENWFTSMHACMHAWICIYLQPAWIWMVNVSSHSLAVL